MRIKICYFSEVTQRVVDLGLPFDIDRYDYHWEGLNKSSQLWYEEAERKGVIMFWMAAEWSTDIPEVVDVRS